MITGEYCEQSLEAQTKIARYVSANLSRFSSTQDNIADVLKNLKLQSTWPIRAVKPKKAKRKLDDTLEARFIKSHFQDQSKGLLFLHDD